MTHRNNFVANPIKRNFLQLRFFFIFLFYDGIFLFLVAPGLRYAIAPGPNNPPLTLALNKSIG